MKQSDQALTDANVKTNLRSWWVNTRTKLEGGLRLTDAGLDFVKETLNLRTYEVPFPATLDLKPQVIIFLDRFIDCPYFLTEESITVLSERKAFELHLFSGDVQKYGLTKAMSRKKTTN
jgi:hypothetical protein